MVELFWQAGNSEIESTVCSEIYSPNLGLVYAGLITYNDINPGTEIRYWAVATDASSQSNQSQSDEKYFYISDQYALGNFENESSMDAWDLRDWGRQYVNHIIKWAINDSPNGLYSPNAYNACYLIEPINLTYFTKAYIKFKSGELESENRVGIVTGLAWTEYGGEILKIETVTMPGKGRMQITGKLGDVMQESVKAAKSFVRSKCLEYGIIPPLFEKKDFHIHVPEGATPKDGPSAGIGMVTSIVSSITNIPVKRDVAMTGEVTLTGQVLPIGGLKEKLLAAHRAGIKEVLIPKENEKDLVDMPKKIIDEIKITPVEFADEVLKIALTKELKKTEWVEVDMSKKDDKSQASIQ